MSPNNLTLQNAWSIVALLLPLGLWLLLYLSLQSGDIRNIANPGSNYLLLQGLRATLPLVAAFVAMTILVVKMRRERPDKFLFLGPLGLLAVYGAIGVIASTLSPERSVALYWSVSYLSVPLVLWAIVWKPKAIEWIDRLISLNWLIVIVAMAILFAFGVIFLSLGSFIFSPGNWLDCTPQDWLEKTSHFIRSTGVGRYAALTGIIALSRLWHPQWRALWGLIFLASMILLLYSGARTAMVGFAVAAPLIVLLSGGRRAALGALILGVALTPVFWTTGAHTEFLDNCIFRGASFSQVIPSASADPELSASQALADPVNTGSPALADPANTEPTQTAPISVDSNSQESEGLNIPLLGRFPSEFFSFSGRTRVWREALVLVGKSPFLGYGFHADRLLLNTHAHNTLMHTLLQTGVLGTIPFMAGLLLAWTLLIRVGLSLARLTRDRKLMFIQAAGMLAFLSIRSVTESTGAFFGVDWLLLGPILLYLQVVNSSSAMAEVTSR